MPLRTQVRMAICVVVLCCGCAEPPTDSSTTDSSTTDDSQNSMFQLKDEVETNREVADGIDELEFIDRDGNSVRLQDFHGKKHVVLVFMRGFAGFLCPYCTTQTSRLIANYEAFESRGAEVLVVYPGKREDVDTFVREAQQSATETPFPILLDEEFEAVTFFDIRDQLARPSTFIIDRAGNVRFAYVGYSPNDRPSIKAMLQQLDGLSET